MTSAASPTRCELHRRRQQIAFTAVDRVVSTQPSDQGDTVVTGGHRQHADAAVLANCTAMCPMRPLAPKTVSV